MIGRGGDFTGAPGVWLLVQSKTECDDEKKDVFVV
jgi:hypothetical protein